MDVWNLEGSGKSASNEGRRQAASAEATGGVFPLRVFNQVNATLARLLSNLIF